MSLGGRFAAWSAATAIAVVSVAGTVPSGAAAGRPAAPQRVTGTVTVSAAASLTDVFPVIAAAFMKKYPGTNVKFNFGGSSALVEQINAGAPVDVLATASEPTMQKAVGAGRVSAPFLFAKNSMAIAMPPGNPAGITRISDLARPGVLVAVCAVAVPCGAATRDVLKLNSVVVKPVTLELDVRDVLGKVMADEVDAGIVYVTDIKAAGRKVTSVAIPPANNVTTTYPIATVIGAPNAAAARAFVTYVRFTTSAQGILRAYGFARPW
jgi:molybdate transport system substrate-binding protein